MKATNRTERGLTLAEVVAAIAILGILIMASTSLTISSEQISRVNEDKQFATQKAIAIMEELKSLAQSTTGSLVVLDAYDDGVNMPPELTIQPVARPDDRVSGNTRVATRWLYLRQISVAPIAGQSTRGVRRVQVTVYKQDPPRGGVTPAPRILAEISSVIRTLSTVAPPTQVYDVYCIAIENVPGWWVYTANLVPYVQGAINELQSRNPGLEFRVHWITKLAYGRDMEYRPYINRDTVSTADINSVYFYPGSLPSGASNPPSLSAYYSADGFSAMMNRDGTPINNYNIDPAAGALNPLPYALADQYNHAMRYPEEVTLYNARVAARDAANNPIYPDEEPTYRLLLDDMVMNPTRYVNSIMINLHGELFPFPPIRNYSDAAKDPEQIAGPDLRWLRAVTHPQQLTYGVNNNLAPQPDDVVLRVYTYESVRDANQSYNATPVMPAPVTVLLRGIDVAASVSVFRLEGGTNQTATQDYVWSAAPNAPAGPAPQPMYATVAPINGSTLITLFNSPFRTRACAGGNCGAAGNDGKGLASTRRLYSMDYIPSSTEDVPTGTIAFPSGGPGIPTGGRDLTDTNANDTKNTARWVIRIPSRALNNYFAGLVPPRPLNQMLTIETRIGLPAPATLPTTGTLFPRNKPANFSATYVWRGTDAWLYGDGTEANPPNLPMSERFQFIGDPRHCPYADLKKQYAALPATASTGPLGMGYNSYFDDFHSTGGGDNIARWPGWMYAGGAMGVHGGNGVADDDGWDSGAGRLEIDIPRAYQITRAAIVSAHTIFTTMTGFSYYYIGIGGEIGYDSANRFDCSIPLSSRPYTGVGGATTEQSIIDSIGGTCTAITQGSGVKYVRRIGTGLGGNDYWWSMNWLGELYPDDAYNGPAGYAATGNLPTGTAAANFIRVRRENIAPTVQSVPARNNLLPTGTAFTQSLRRTARKGCTTLFWAGLSTQTFHHDPNDNLAALTSTATTAPYNEGSEMAATAGGYNFPLLNPIPSNRPFDINLNMPADNPERFLNTAYGPAHAITEIGEFYRHPYNARRASALITLRNTTTNRVAFVVVNGLSPTGDSGTAFIARWSFLSLIHSYMDAGLYAGAEACAGCPLRVNQVPRVRITSPDPTTQFVDTLSIPIVWNLSWTRWDGNRYTPSYVANYAEPTVIRYQILFSQDNGNTWRFYQDGPAGLPAAVGVMDATKTTLATTVTLSTPASTFPEGNVILRVEAYRSGFAQHYSYHQFTAYIRRTT